ncbi:SDR family oxidoreductase [Providencia heimbachae]|uniref:Putative NAD(P)-dependent oxidoreductase n=1 Tax=Providencia heimbachae ATCC 35613 TaxID=1354272 RepID=A0A1B7JMP8_9GAMM|nr:SDR family oxidoreductase [Providencia heimbachae]OAT49203.1 putative NAD(P)-dependent oxidoreductase [Providencia heimbachae ATCC 35613]QCJ69329.1 oxidoreductase [Providencia heimbachae]SQH12401.1 3-oxoacyl-[acyl-carrier-protein] reductase FabG [Providencia heimbachae]
MQKSVLITGASSGIGFCAAQTLRQRGYHVIAACRKEADILRLQSLGFDTVALDLDDNNSIDAAADAVLSLCQGRLFGLFNNAGFGVYGALTTVSRQQLESQFSANFFGVHQLTLRLLPAMISHNEGRIVQTSSVMGIISTPGRGAYAASKYALEAWSDALRLELKGSGIHVSLIEPGPIHSAFTQNVAQTQKDKPVQNPGIAARFTLTPEHVVQKLIHALESPRPRIRYSVTLLTVVVRILKRILPDRLMDKILANQGKKA